MKSRFFRRAAYAACALMLAAVMIQPGRAVHRSVAVYLNEKILSSDAAPFIDDGTAYVPLAAFARAMGSCEVSWDGTSALVTAEGLTLLAQPDTQWVEANGRMFYVPGNVRLVDGRTMIPARTAAAVYGAQISWDGSSRSVHIAGGGQMPESGSTYYDADTLYWLSRVISAESRGEPLLGQIAVGNVVLNRLNSPVFPNSLYDVIFQPGQFEPVENGTIYQDPYYLSVIAAKLCLEGVQVAGDSMYFFAPDLSPGTWIVNNRTYYTTIGCHRFYL